MYKKLITGKCLLLVIDVQEKLVNMLKETIVDKKTAILAATANTLKIPAIVTEQYPKGLGETVEIVKTKLSKTTEYFEKTTFNAFENSDIRESITKTNKKQVILCGIEAHICVLQTAIELIKEGYEVFVIKDACGSRNLYEFELAMDRLQQAGAIITCTEMALFELLGSSKHPNFKELQALIK